MNPGDLLEQLAPLRQPEAVHWWPPAPGWWLLALLLAGCLCYAGYRLWQFYRRGAPLRAARAELEAIEARSDALSARAAALSALQRQTAMALAGRENCAGLTGERWAAFLNSLTRDGSVHFDSTLAEFAYRAEVAHDDYDDALRATRAWLATLERPA